MKHKRRNVHTQNSTWECFVCLDLFLWQDLERREAELKELHHLLEENHTAVTKWKTEAVETAKVWVHKHSVQ